MKIHKIKKQLKHLLSTICGHWDWVGHGHVFQIKVKTKYKKLKTGYGIRCDIWEIEKCQICGKVLNKTKLKSDLRESAVPQYIKKI